MSIEIKNLKHIYDIGTPYEIVAINDVNINIKSGELIGLIGHTGSGKSTLIQHLNGLLKPSSGTIIIDGIDLGIDKKSIKNIRKKVGLVFQYPEYQLFEETVEKDIAFGPKNLGVSEEEIKIRVKESLKNVGLEYDDIAKKAPFELSGGQKRKVAIAGVLAMKPSTLILDEPTAGLDPKSRDELLKYIKNLHEKEKITIIFVTHNMEEVARLASRLIVMHNSEVVYDDTPVNVFKNMKHLQSIGLDVPQLSKLVYKLNEKGFDLSSNIMTFDEIKNALLKKLKEK